MQVFIAAALLIVAVSASGYHGGHAKKSTSGSYSLEYTNGHGKHVEASGSYETTHKSHGYNQGYRTGHYAGYNRGGYGYNKGYGQPARRFNYNVHRYDSHHGPYGYQHTVYGHGGYAHKNNYNHGYNNGHRYNNRHGYNSYNNGHKSGHGYNHGYAQRSHGYNTHGKKW